MQKLFCEANVMYWGKCLLKLTYDFIDRSLAAYPDLPPFNSPHVHFIDAGLALSYAPGVTRYSKVGSIHTAFLIEEFIEGRNNNFIKYIHNSTATPLLDPDEEGYELTLFFCFAQHVQYAKTGGLAFISDFEGERNDLTKIVLSND
ncbi:hypothetical protein SCLCIDRAFT_16688 [Scleroderma citrinum Foug A]|uniref:Alpha-type protein kinase domain-containing protein n=1 Tax=Scleroderma citrinum Foug A TaxID=1036808 RepID=A0A0C2ZAB0_9AGAM|nr:hypothetical protein SCLCIDRAFT_16688 [Scleroderma citrinum Foug A]